MRSAIEVHLLRCARRESHQTGPLWARGALVGKVGGVFCSTASQHQETTITSFPSTLLHHGMIVVGLPYTFKDLATMREVTGGTPYDASCVTGAIPVSSSCAAELCSGARRAGRGNSDQF